VKRKVRHHRWCELLSRFCIKTSKGVKEECVYNSTHTLEAGAAVAGLVVAPGEVAGGVVAGGGAVVEPVLAERLAVEAGWPRQAVVAIQQTGFRQGRGKDGHQITDWNFG
jgi:anti-sigma factor RsiW